MFLEMMQLSDALYSLARLTELKTPSEYKTNIRPSKWKLEEWSSTINAKITARDRYRNTKDLSYLQHLHLHSSNGILNPFA